MFNRAAVIVLGVCLGLASVGCESMGMKKDSSMMTGDKGIVAVSNHGSVVFLPTGNGGVQMLSTGGDPTCEQCKMDAANYFKSGKLTEKCSVCGATRYALMHGH